MNGYILYSYVNVLFIITINDFLNNYNTIYNLHNGKSLHLGMNLADLSNNIKALIMC